MIVTVVALALSTVLICWGWSWYLGGIERRSWLQAVQETEAEAKILDPEMYAKVGPAWFDHLRKEGP